HTRFWPYLEASRAPAEVFGCVAELSTDLLSDHLSRTQFSALLRTTLMWCEKVATGDHRDQLDGAVADLIDTVAGYLGDNVIVFVGRDTVVRELVTATDPASATGKAAAELYRRLLIAGYDRLADRLDIP